MEGREQEKKENKTNVKIRSVKTKKKTNREDGKLIKKDRTRKEAIGSKIEEEI